MLGGLDTLFCTDFRDIDITGNENKASILWHYSLINVRELKPYFWLDEA